MDTKVMQKQIMRRVYYSYTISLATHSMLWRGVFLGAAAMLLADWLHVASIFNNFLSTPVGSVPQFVANSFVQAALHGEAMTVAIILAAGLLAVSSAYKLVKDLRFGGLSMQTA
jgi:hypothetical protein